MTLIIATVACGLAAYGLIYTIRDANSNARDAERYRHATQLLDQNITTSMSLATGRTAIVNNTTFDIVETKKIGEQTLVTGKSSTGATLTATVWQ